MFKQPTKRSLRSMPRYSFKDAAPTRDNAREGQHPSGAQTFGASTEGSGYNRSYTGYTNDPPSTFGDPLSALPGDNDPRRLENQLPPSDMTPTKWGSRDVSATDPVYPASWGGSVSPGREVRGVTGELRGTEGYGPTGGGTAGPMMKHTLIGRYEVDGDKWNYWLEHSPQGIHLYRKSPDDGSLPAEHIASFRHDPNSYIHTDQTATHYRVWRVGRDQMVMADPVSPGTSAGLNAARTVGDTARKIAELNRRNREYWK